MLEIVVISCQGLNDRSGGKVVFPERVRKYVGFVKSEVKFVSFS